MLGKLIAFSTFYLAVAGVSPVVAQEAVKLEGDVKVVRIVEQGGQRVETYADPVDVIPGDRLKFTTRYRNASTETIADFVITNLLPKAVVLPDDGDFAVSVDGGQSFGPLGSLTLSLPDGSTRPATLADVEQMRWTIASIAPGATGEVTYFASVR